VIVDYIDRQRESFGVGAARYADPSVTLRV
jgi:hypothetical protein